MYQAGEVDYLVATDAIGMGLNMDLDHVAFTGLRKFDGRGWRPSHICESCEWHVSAADGYASDESIDEEGALSSVDVFRVSSVDHGLFVPAVYHAYDLQKGSLVSWHWRIAGYKRQPFVFLH